MKGIYTLLLITVTYRALDISVKNVTYRHAHKISERKILAGIPPTLSKEDLFLKSFFKFIPYA